MAFCLLVQPASFAQQPEAPQVIFIVDYSLKEEYLFGGGARVSGKEMGSNLAKSEAWFDGSKGSAFSYSAAGGHLRGKLSVEGAFKNRRHVTWEGAWAEIYIRAFVKSPPGARYSMSRTFSGSLSAKSVPSNAGSITVNFNRVGSVSSPDNSLSFGGPDYTITVNNRPTGGVQFFQEYPGVPYSLVYDEGGSLNVRDVVDHYHYQGGDQFGKGEVNIDLKVNCLVGLELVCRPLESSLLDPCDFRAQTGRHCYFLVTFSDGKKETFSAAINKDEDIEGVRGEGERDRDPTDPPGGCSGSKYSESICLGLLPPDRCAAYDKLLQAVGRKGGRYHFIDNNSNLWVRRRLDEMGLENVKLPSSAPTNQSEYCQHAKTVPVQCIGALNGFIERKRKQLLDLGSCPQ